MRDITSEACGPQSPEPTAVPVASGAARARAYLKRVSHHRFLAFLMTSNVRGLPAISGHTSPAAVIR